MGVLAAEPAREGVREAPAGPVTPKGVRSLRILVAEDNVVNQQVAVGMLGRAGHTAKVASNGREALAFLDQETFDLILMDVQMPELDGLETAVAIREHEKSAGGHIPIVAVTAHTMKGDADRCFAAGMDAYVGKPLRIEELLAAIQSLTGAPAERPVPDPPAPPIRGPLDTVLLLERVGGDRQELRKLVNLFLADSPKLLARIRRAATRGDAPALQAAAHALKGAVSNFAAPAATEAALSLQRMGEAGDIAGAERGCALLERELERLGEALEALLSKDAGPSRGPKRRR
jgi:CheY-like chemotaxis protein/HPt (histidine-containing phosphotransfer) domain-containing protein